MSMGSNRGTISTFSSQGGLSALTSPAHINDNKCISLVDDKTIRLIAPDGTRKSVSAVDDKIYSFDKIFPESSDQEDIYASVSSLVKATVNGYNTTIFAYGCTGSGKSYTM